jgi:hypothetical protein
MSVGMETSSIRRGWLAAWRTAAFMGAPLWIGLKGLTQIGTDDTDQDTDDGILQLIDSGWMFSMAGRA